MHLVDGHRPSPGVVLPTLVQPGLVVPNEARHIAHNGRMIGRRLEMQGARVRLDERCLIMGADNFVFIAGPHGEPGQEKLPDTRSPQGAHRVGPTVPMVMVADHRHAASRGSPNRERNTGHPLQSTDVRSELIEDLVVVALTNQEQILLGNCREKTIGVLVFLHSPVGITDLEAVAEGRRHRVNQLEHP